MAVIGRKGTFSLTDEQAGVLASSLTEGLREDMKESIQVEGVSLAQYRFESLLFTDWSDEKVAEYIAHWDTVDKNRVIKMIKENKEC